VLEIFGMDLFIYTQGTTDTKGKGIYILDEKGAEKKRKQGIFL
jgi:hypothetical protein